MSKKKKKELVPDYVFDVDVYNMNIAVFFSAKSADNYFHKEWGQEADHYQTDMTDHTQGMAFLFETETGGLIHGVILPTMPQPEILAHECSHLVDMISQSVGMPCTMDTTEPRAYLMQYLYSTILQPCLEWKKEHPEWPNSD